MPKSPQSNPVCPRCLSRDVAPQEVSGRGHVETYTVNHQQWIPGSDAYIIAATPAIGPTNADPNTFATNGYGGISPTGKVLGEQLAASKVRRVAILELDDFPSDLYDDIAQAMPGVEIVDGTQTNTTTNTTILSKLFMAPAMGI